MPSRELAEISEKIEGLKTDSLGKFYRYAALLHSITLRDKNKQYDELLPKDTRNSSQPMALLELAAGSLDLPFFNLIREYCKQFDYQRSELGGAWAVAQKLAPKLGLAYFRKGPLADIAFINQRMFEHLDMPVSSSDPNNALYTSIDFKEIQPDILDLLRETSKVHENGFACVDNSFRVLIALLVVAAGLIIVVSLTHVLLGLAMMTMGVLGAFLCVKQLQFEFSNMKQLTLDWAEKAENYRHKKTETTVHMNFFVKPIVLPLISSTYTIVEQLGFGGCEDQRAEMIRKYNDTPGG